MLRQLRRRLDARFDAWARRRTPASLPVSFDRHRIYVLPTRFGLFFGVLLLVMGAGALNYNNNPALLLCLLLAGAGIASLLQAQLQLGGLEIHAIGAEPVPAGSPLQLRVHARAQAGRERRGLRVECAGAAATLLLDNGTGEATCCFPRGRAVGWIRAGCASPPRGRSGWRGPGPTPGPIRRCWSIPRPKRPDLRCRQAKANARSRA